ncbi:hypothetical protein PR048_007386 [Dryococelus australis]|uniref:BACK domain-containing protein n=1 Tax=Dryococelus australis TaxID=614101 RepID=A0ABQ9HUJ2_9NEOP|nr:hypothetical protein PR048_007386 [Dryococelus australis]
MYVLRLSLLKQVALTSDHVTYPQLCQEDEFLQLMPMQLVALIKRDELNVQDERQVYNAVLKWVKYDEEQRYPRMEKILQAVRCQYLTPDFLRDQMKNCDLLKKLPACREYLAQIFRVSSCPLPSPSRCTK